MPDNVDKEDNSDNAQGDDNGPNDEGDEKDGDGGGLVASEDAAGADGSKPIAHKPEKGDVDPDPLKDHSNGKPLPKKKDKGDVDPDPEKSYSQGKSISKKTDKGNIDPDPLKEHLEGKPKPGKPFSSPTGPGVKENLDPEIIDTMSKSVPELMSGPGHAPKETAKDHADKVMGKLKNPGKSNSHDLTDSSTGGGPSKSNSQSNPGEGGLGGGGN